MMDFNKLLETLSEGYYSLMFYLITEATALVLGVLYVRKQPIGRLFILYIAFEFTILIIDSCLESIPGISSYFSYKFANTTNTIISVVELFVYFVFFSEVLKNKKLKPLFVFIFLFYLIIVFSFIITGFRFISTRFSYLANIISAFELLILIPFCIIFYRQILNQISAVEPITAKPSFWIVTGILLFSTLSLPNFLLVSFSFRSGNSILETIACASFYTSFAFNFIFLSKAFLCKKPLTI